MSIDSPSNFLRREEGKSKAIPNDDYDDLNPIITYRHLHATNLGVKDPLRVVGLCDSDAFYAACEQVRLNLDPSRPLVVLQWDALIAVNYPARTFGISRMMKLKEAKERCPELVVQHVATYKEGELEPGYWDNVDTQTHKVSLDYYRRESAKIISIFKESLPTGEIEKASIDEAFIDFTRPVRDTILQRYSYLAQIPPDGIDSPLPPPPPVSWDGLGAIVPVHPEIEENIGSSKNDESNTWHDVALSIAAELMEKIRDEVRTKLGYTTSAGISRNKFLAKLVASYKKPNTQSILCNAAIPNYLRPMAFQKIRFLGGKLGSAVVDEYGVSTVGDLLTISLGEMQTKFGESAYWVYELLRGIDRSEVKEKSLQSKSMLASKNLPSPITRAADGQHWIRVLAAELALRLNEARKTTPTLWPKTIVLHARKGYETARSKQAPFPYTRNVTVDVIASAGDRLWKELVGNANVMKVTNIQLAFTGLETAESGQQTIEGFFKTPETKRPQPSTSGAVSLKRSREACDDALPRTELLAEEMDTFATSFNCQRCGKRVELAKEFDNDDVEDADRERALTSLKVEHDDFHFAQDLSRSTVDIPPPANKKKKGGGQKKPEGITKFFTKQDVT